MLNSAYPWVPPPAGTEAEHVVGALDRLRTTFRWKADDLDATGLRTRIGASALTLGGLLKHLARAEAEMFTTNLSGSPIDPPWDTADWATDPDWDFKSAADDSPEQLYTLWDDTIERSRARLDAALTDGGLDQLVRASWDGQQFSLRRLVCDLIEEYGRHTGHADLLREAVDGRVGEDPPVGWRAQSGRTACPADRCQLRSAGLSRLTKGSCRMFESHVRLGDTRCDSRRSSCHRAHPRPRLAAGLSRSLSRQLPRSTSRKAWAPASATGVASTDPAQPARSRDSQRERRWLHLRGPW